MWQLKIWFFLMGCVFFLAKWIDVDVGFGFSVAEIGFFGSFAYLDVSEVQ